MEYWTATLTTAAIVGAATISLGRWFGARLGELKEDTERRFREAKEDSDRRFGEVKEEFRVTREDINRRFGKTDRRFDKAKEETDGRFDEAKKDTDQRFRGMMEFFQAHAAENREAHAAIGQSIKDSETRVVAVMNQRFEDFGKRVDEMSKRIDDLRSTDLIQDLQKHFGSAGR